MFRPVRTVTIFATLLVGSVGLLAQGDLEAGGVGLLLATMVGMVLVGPFRSLPHPQRIRYRIGATACVLAAWLTGGVVRWGWDTPSYVVAGAVGVYALFRAALPRRVPSRTPDTVSEVAATR